MGSLKLRLQEAGSHDRGVIHLPYSLAAGASATLGTLGWLMSPVSWIAEWNVRIDDDSASGLRVTRSLAYVLPFDVDRRGARATVRKGREVSYRVRTEDAFKHHQPLGAKQVTFDLTQNDTLVQTQTVTTEASGDAEVRLFIDQPGEFKVRARLDTQGVTSVGKMPSPWTTACRSCS